MSEISSDFDRLLEIAEEIVRDPDFNPDDAHNIGYDGSYFDLSCMDGETTKFEIRKIAWVGGAVPVLLNYGRHPRLLHLASQLLGSDEINYLINNAHIKMPGITVAFGWHQDGVNRGFTKVSSRTSTEGAVFCRLVFGGS